MIINLLKLAGFFIAGMAVVMALGYLYVMNEMRNEMKGMKMKPRKMIWAGMNPPSADDWCWASGNGFVLEWNMKVAEILQIKDHKVRVAKLRELADCRDAGIVTTSRWVVRDLKKEVEA